MSMLGQLAVMSAEAAESLGPVPDFDGLMAMLSGDDSVDLGSVWYGVDRVLGDLLGRRPVLSGIPVTDDLVCGPAMFLTPDEVRSMAVELSGVSDEHIAAALARHVSDLYPQVSDRADEADDLSFFTIEATRKAISLFERAALRNEGALFVVL
jgi:Domain of unknown function (DUF1877)